MRLRDVGHGFVANRTRVKKGPGRAPKERLIEQRGVCGRVRKETCKVGAIEVHEHAAHVKDDVGDGLVQWHIL